MIAFKRRRIAHRSTLAPQNKSHHFVENNHKSVAEFPFGGRSFFPNLSSPLWRSPFQNSVCRWETDTEHRASNSRTGHAVSDRLPLSRISVERNLSVRQREYGEADVAYMGADDRDHRIATGIPIIPSRSVTMKK